MKWSNAFIKTDRKY